MKSFCTTVTNLPLTIQDAELRVLLGEADKMSAVKLYRHEDEVHAIVDFDNKPSAEYVCRHDGADFRGRKIGVRRSKFWERAYEEASHQMWEMARTAISEEQQSNLKQLLNEGYEEAHARTLRRGPRHGTIGGTVDTLEEAAQAVANVMNTKTHEVDEEAGISQALDDRAAAWEARKQAMRERWENMKDRIAEIRDRARRKAEETEEAALHPEGAEQKEPTAAAQALSAGVEELDKALQVHAERVENKFHEAHTEAVRDSQRTADRLRGTVAGVMQRVEDDAGHIRQQVVDEDINTQVARVGGDDVMPPSPAMNEGKRAVQASA